MSDNIWHFSPAELRGYAIGLRRADLLLAASWARSGMVDGHHMSLMVQTIRDGWQREAEIAMGFAARLDGAQAEPDESPTLYWRPGWAEQDASPDVLAALAEAEMLQPIALRSTAWEGERWALRLPAGDCEEEIDWFETREEAIAFLADWRTLTGGAPVALTQAEAAQDGLADAVAAAGAPNMAEDMLASRREAARAMFLAGKKPREIEAQTGIPEGSINSWASKFGWRKDLAKLQAGQPRPAESAPGPRGRHAHGVSGNGPKPGTWTNERESLLRCIFPGKRPMDEVLHELNLLPGPPIASIGAIKSQAQKLALHRRQGPRPDGAIAPPAGTHPEPMLSEDKAEALDRLRRGVAAGALDLIDYFGCTQDEALALVDQHRAQTRKAA